MPPIRDLEPPGDDGLLIPDIRIWGERKYRLIRGFCEMFTGSMRDKWECLVYVDLFAGAGLARFKDTGVLVRGSPLIALGLPVPFDKYIFCESGRDKLGALEERVRRDHGDRDVQFVRGDVNKALDEILHHIPKPSKVHKVLGFSLADPFRMSNLHFDTVRRLSGVFFDQLVLIPTYMDANRNLDTYLDPDNSRIESFTGCSDWRQQWARDRASGMSFDLFLTKRFADSMESLDYRPLGAERTELIRSVPNNLPLYRLALFSRHQLGEKFWNEARKYATDQIPLL